MEINSSQQDIIHVPKKEHNSLLPIDNSLNAKDIKKNHENTNQNLKKRYRSNCANEDQFHHREALKIANLLHEKKISLVKRVIKIVGISKTREVLDETLALENLGGLKTTHGERRTPGGAFFTLLKSYVTKEEYKDVYAIENDRKKKRKKIIADRNKMKVDQVGIIDEDNKVLDMDLDKCNSGMLGKEDLIHVASSHQQVSQNPRFMRTRMDDD